MISAKVTLVAAAVAALALPAAAKARGTRAVGSAARMLSPLNFGSLQ